MKRICTLAMTCLMLLALAAPAFADIMWEPMDNHFYETHRSQCQYNTRSYYANGREGFVTLWDAPNGSLVTAQYENGELLWVGYTYKDWALVSVWSSEDRKETTGWVPMPDLYLKYDYISFEEEYGDQFRDYNGEFADYTPREEGEEFWLWDYPHAYGPKDTIEASEDILARLRGTADEPSYISKVYIDGNGHPWGYVTYMYGLRNFWINLDNPTGDGVMTSCIPEAGDLISTGEITEPQQPVMPRQSYLPAILVAAVIAAAIAALAYFYGGKGRAKKGE